MPTGRLQAIKHAENARLPACGFADLRRPPSAKPLDFAAGGKYCGLAATDTNCASQWTVISVARRLDIDWLSGLERKP